MGILGKVLSILVIGAILLGMLALTSIVFINVALFIWSLPIWPYRISVLIVVFGLILGSWLRSRRRSR